ncbi:unnamed protein product [Closterium sp. Naga37s-1]|nr:unnamed protein product [Closterium sp. Naga37s-1]
MSLLRMGLKTRPFPALSPLFPPSLPPLPSPPHIRVILSCAFPPLLDLPVRQAAERRVEGGALPPWAQDNAACGNVPQPPWVRGSDSSNLASTRVAQRDIWAHQFPPPSPLPPHATAPASAGQLQGMSVALRVAFTSGRVLVPMPGTFQPARHPHCQGEVTSESTQKALWPSPVAVCSCLCQEPSSQPTTRTAKVPLPAHSPSLPSFASLGQGLFRSVWPCIRVVCVAPIPHCIDHAVLQSPLPLPCLAKQQQRYSICFDTQLPVSLLCLLISLLSLLPLPSTTCIPLNASGSLHCYFFRPVSHACEASAMQHYTTSTAGAPPCKPLAHLTAQQLGSNETLICAVASSDASYPASANASSERAWSEAFMRRPFLVERQGALLNISHTQLQAHWWHSQALRFLLRWPSPSFCRTLSHHRSSAPSSPPLPSPPSLRQAHWWTAQALRFLLRWPSPSLCHTLNRHRSSALGPHIASLSSSLCSPTHTHVSRTPSPHLTPSFSRLVAPKLCVSSSIFCSVFLCPLQAHWWTAQALRFLLRWPSPSLCHALNRHRSSALGPHIASLSSAFLTEQHAIVTSLLKPKSEADQGLGLDLRSEAATTFSPNHLSRFADWTFLYPKPPSDPSSSPAHYDSVGAAFGDLLVASESDFFVGDVGSRWSRLIYGLKCTNGRLYAGFLSV